MSSNPVIIPSSAKGSSNSIQSSSTTYSQGPSVSSFDGGSQRRSASSGAGSATRSVPTPRNNQPLKKQHKAQKKSRWLADEDALAESAAMKSINSRKGQTSITHLMNFALPPRPQYQSHYGSHTRHQRRNPTWGLGSGYHAIDKARYVHANYRFIVKPNQEYHTQTIDADVHLDWDSVLQVLASEQTQLASCPICLGAPVAPRMAKCGHIFCLPCLIRYMHSTDDSNAVVEKRARWKKCPICEDSIYISETRPVRWFVGQEASMLREGGDVLLRLLKREPGSTLPLPRDAADVVPPAEDIPWFHVAEVMDYARFMKGGEDYMTAQYDSEIDILMEQEREDELMFGDDPTWTRKAVTAIHDAKERLKGMGNPPVVRDRVEKRAQKTPIIFDTSPRPNEPPQSLSETSGTNSASNESELSGGGPLLEGVHKMHISDTPNTSDQQSALPRMTTRPTAAQPRAQGSPFFFYQALPNFYLSSLDIRILRTAFGEFSSFPTTILPRIEHISTGHVVDDDLRKRAKYLAHLPFGCEVSFLECDWTGSVGSEILDQFSSEIERRRKRNFEKEAREEKERLRAEKDEEDKRYAAARRMRPSASAVEKSFSDNDFQPLGPPPSTSMEGAAMSSSPPWQNSHTHSAYATLATPGTSPEGARTVWGTAAIGSGTPSSDDVHDQARTDGWLQGWEKDILDQNDAVAMVEASMAAEGSSSSASRPASNVSKKKKNKKITLMSTSNARRGA